MLYDTFIQEINYYVRVCSEHHIPTTLYCTHLVVNENNEIVAECMNVFCHVHVSKRTPLMTNKQSKKLYFPAMNNLLSFWKKSKKAKLKSQYSYELDLGPMYSFAEGSILQPPSVADMYKMMLPPPTLIRWFPRSLLSVKHWTLYPILT